MGCDIHISVEVSLPLALNRSERVVRALERAAAAGDPDALAELRRHELRWWETAYNEAYLCELPICNPVEAWGQRFGAEHVRLVFGFDS